MSVKWVCIRSCVYLNRLWRVGMTLSLPEDKTPPRHFARPGEMPELSEEEKADAKIVTKVAEVVNAPAAGEADYLAGDNAEGTVTARRAGDDTVPMEELEGWEPDRLRDYLRDVLKTDVPANYRRDWCLRRIATARAERMAER